jgi:3',5'-cyclic AMP phosphodiesterase CpdA
MRIAIFSDLHEDMQPHHGPSPQFPYRRDIPADVIVLAGDIREPRLGKDNMAWATRAFPGRKVVYVAGNHEFYNRRIDKEEQVLREAAKAAGVHFLQRDSVVIDGVRFLGCTLWTDMRLPIRDDLTGAMTSDRKRAADVLDRRMNDFQSVWFQGITSFRPAHMLVLHRAHRAWLASALAEPFDGPTVVVTHHAPHPHSIPAERKSKWTSTGYASRLPLKFFKLPRLWIHGHVHTSSDYQVGRCRVVCNPRGYPLPAAAREGQFQNRAWCERGYLVEV